MQKIVTVTNQKGGVGKTSLSVHIAALAHQKKMKTLFVDLDGQRNSTFLTTRKKDHEYTVKELWANETIHPVKSIFGFDVLAGSAFAVNEQDLKKSITSLQKLLKTEYEAIIFDTPPAYSLKQIAPLYLGGKLVVPVEPDIFAIQGFMSILEIYKTATKFAKLEMSIVINKKIINSTNHQKIIDMLRSSISNKYISQYELTNRTLVPNALKSGTSVWEFSKVDSSAKVWKAFCESVLAFD